MLIEEKLALTICNLYPEKEEQIRREFAQYIACCIKEEDISPELRAVLDKMYWCNI